MTDRKDYQLLILNSYNMCCSESYFREAEINGECPDCGEPTVDGEAYYSCSYSPTECETCGYAPCDGSC